MRSKESGAEEKRREESKVENYTRTRHENRKKKGRKNEKNWNKM